MIPSVLPRSLPDRLADGLGNAPRPVALGLEADLFDTLASQSPQGRRGGATPVVDHQCGSGVCTKISRYPASACKGLFDSSTTPRINVPNT